MLDREKRVAIMRLFIDDVSISEIARKVGASRESVCRVIDSVFERVPLVKRLEKEVKKAELMKKDLASELVDIRRAVDILFSRVLGLLDISPRLKIERQVCIYCDETLERFKEKVPSGRFVRKYRCRYCNKVFTFPYEF